QGRRAISEVDGAGGHRAPARGHGGGERDRVTEGRRVQARRHAGRGPDRVDRLDDAAAARRQRGRPRVRSGDGVGAHTQRGRGEGGGAIGGYDHTGGQGRRAISEVDGAGGHRAPARGHGGGERDRVTEGRRVQARRDRGRGGSPVDDLVKAVRAVLEAGARVCRSDGVSAHGQRGGGELGGAVSGD